MVRVGSPFFAGLATSSSSFHLICLLCMVRFFRLPALAGFLFSAGLLLNSPAAHAQLLVPAAAPAAHGYDFLTVTTVEGVKSFSAIMFAPDFQGKSEIPLESIQILGTEKFKERIRENTLRVNEQLSALTVAGWELVQVYAPNSPANARCYLFRKAKS